MAMDLILVGGSVLSAMWGSTVSEYNKSVNFLAEARKAKLEFKKYYKERETNLKITEFSLDSDFVKLEDNKSLLVKFNKLISEKLNNYEMLFDSSLEKIKAYQFTIAKTNNISLINEYEIKIKEEEKICDNIIYGLRKIEQSLVKLVSNNIEQVLTKEEVGIIIEQ